MYPGVCGQGLLVMVVGVYEALIGDLKCWVNWIGVVFWRLAEFKLSSTSLLGCWVQDSTVDCFPGCLFDKDRRRRASVKGRWSPADCLILMTWSV